ncbi:hypothetical protein KSP40_PGU018751 [Platanthera guangdongensis]|uniref:Uncharacterized protein n=1 Tax=Platanthera guangdongensis TaxID=2320717 RepID=A0ABR2MH37_9ASPA
MLASSSSKNFVGHSALRFVVIGDACSPPYTILDDCRFTDVIVLTFACNSSESLYRLSSYWLPGLKRVESVELSNEAREFLKRVFFEQDSDNGSNGQEWRRMWQGGCWSLRQAATWGTIVGCCFEIRAERLEANGRLLLWCSAEDGDEIGSAAEDLALAL